MRLHANELKEHGHSKFKRERSRRAGGGAGGELALTRTPHCSRMPCRFDACCSECCGMTTSTVRLRCGGAQAPLPPARLARACDFRSMKIRQERSMQPGKQVCLGRSRDSRSRCHVLPFCMPRRAPRQCGSQTRRTCRPQTLACCPPPCCRPRAASCQARGAAGTGRAAR
jgi:hypothetical protein